MAENAGFTNLFTAASYDELEAGDVFIYRHSGGNCLGIVTENTEGRQKGIATLGPTFPNGENKPSLRPQPGNTLVALKKNFKITLSASPTAWHFKDFYELPDTQTYLAVANDRICLPIQFSDGLCLVDLQTGVFRVARAEKLAFVQSWRISVLDEDGGEDQTILSHD